MAALISTKTQSSPTIFFIPGAWHGPWVFDNVRSILSARGFETEASSLATVGSTDPSVGLLSDAAKARSALTTLIDDGKEVILVAHSYGGIVASNAVEDLEIEQRISNGLTGGVVMILYVTAFAVRPNTNLLTAVGGHYADWWDVSEDGFITPINPVDIFYADVEPSVAEKVIATIRPMPINFINDASLYDPWNQGFEVGYIFAEEDHAIHISAQKAMFAQLPAGSFSASLRSSHSPFFSMPDALADAIQDAANYAIMKRSFKLIPNST
ncbi:hypothetical protein EKO27_g9141 [Xylaria grammica]|uniref:AB hydrolase-1 domain-containing protein n=1 Tax=Xylaria grammica TaxID=363999 RepID=A0A439CUX1_9PEZI|nr:hypothetical protein EKO27_g9141 [Xylaria grammica]